jgi:hypothetical protein
MNKNKNATVSTKVQTLTNKELKRKWRERVGVEPTYPLA